MNAPELSGIEQLLVDLSTRFTGLPIERVGEEIERGLRRIVDLLGADRSTVFEFSPDGQSLTPLASWARPGIELFTQVPRAITPWYQAQLVRGETIRFSALDELPDEAALDVEYARRIGLRSNLTIPIAVGGQSVCALAIGAFRQARDWPDPVVDRLRLIGQILASALHRQRTETVLQKAVAELEQTREELQVRLEEIRELKERVEAENVYLRAESRQDRGFDAIVGESRAMLDVLAKVSQVAPTSSAVLLLGETGTGKQLLAHAIHDHSPRRHGPFVKVNCAALPPTLIETELFGHEKGAFTGAAGPKAGRFELADGGTLFLDEIGELTPEVQVKLLGVLQDGQFERVGSTRTRTVNARIVAATNRDLGRAIAEGRFREDLYYRLSVFPIQVPPLRERREDIPLLVWACINRRQTQIGRKHRAGPGPCHGRVEGLRVARQYPGARERDRARAHPLDRLHAARRGDAGCAWPPCGELVVLRAPRRAGSRAHPARGGGLWLENPREGQRCPEARPPSQHASLPDGEARDHTAGATLIGLLRSSAAQRRQPPERSGGCLPAGR